MALKYVEKAAIDKIKKRHPNVHNEVKMEKRALNKLQTMNGGPHPGIITLHATFQDYYTLYYLVELCRGGEMWAQTSAAASAPRRRGSSRAGGDSPRARYLVRHHAPGSRPTAPGSGSSTVRGPRPSSRSWGSIHRMSNAP